eukprot:4667857-Pleurochrysis_carterae.AAC.1
MRAAEQRYPKQAYVYVLPRKLEKVSAFFITAQGSSRRRKERWTISNDCLALISTLFTRHDDV